MGKGHCTQHAEVVPPPPKDAEPSEIWQCFLGGVAKFLKVSTSEDVMSYPTLRQAWLSKGDVSLDGTS